MIKLKAIERQDLAVLEEHYLKFEPYSDFNVVSMWGYMVPGARYAVYKGSVLYQMMDYNTDKPYLTVFGDKSVNELVTELCRQTPGRKLVLYSVPESTCKFLKKLPMVTAVDEDISNHDYIFSVESIANLSTDKLRRKKKSLNKLLRRYPNLSSRIIDHTDPAVRRKLYDLFKRWVEASGATDWHREYQALQRELTLDGFHIMCLGAFDGPKLIGFTVNEIESNGYYQGHFGKIDYKYRALGIYLEHETAKYMHEHHNLNYMNLQQDMGIEGIRYYKASLDPHTQLKKYTVTLDPRKTAA